MTQFNTDSRSVSQLNLLLFNKWTLQNGEIWVEAASEGQKCSETGTGSDSLVLWGCRSNHNPKIISDGAAHLQTQHRNTKSQTTEAEQEGWRDKTVDSNYNSQTALLEEVSNQTTSDFSELELEKQNMLESNDSDIIRSPCSCANTTPADDIISLSRWLAHVSMLTQ